MSNAEVTLYPLSCETVRIEYYLAKMHTGQRTKGKRYSDIIPTDHVSLVNQKVYPDDAYLHAFQYYDPVHGISLNGRTCAILVELPKVEKLAHEKPVKER
jgi:hypothetical protein